MQVALPLPKYSRHRPRQWQPPVLAICQEVRDELVEILIEGARRCGRCFIPTKGLLISGGGNRSLAAHGCSAAICDYQMYEQVLHRENYDMNAGDQIYWKLGGKRRTIELEQHSDQVARIVDKIIANPPRVAPLDPAAPLSKLDRNVAILSCPMTKPTASPPSKTIQTSSGGPFCIRAKRIL